MTRREVVVEADVAASWIDDGMTVALGGFILSGHPMSLIRAMVRRGVRDLTVVASASASLEIDLLVAAGCVRRLIAPYVGAESLAPIGPAFKRAAQKGEVDVWECDEWMYYAGLRAAAQNLPYMPCKGLVGTSYPEVNPDLKLYRDPLNGTTMIAVPPIAPDLAILHAACADAYGNVQHVGTGFGDRALHNAAARTVVTVERIIPVEEVRANPHLTSIAYADAVVRAPWGAHPFASPGFYREDTAALQRYVDAARAHAEGDSSSLSRFLDDFVTGPEDHMAYLERIGIRQLVALHEY